MAFMHSCRLFLTFNNVKNKKETNNSQDYLGQTCSWWDNFWTGWKVSWDWKNYFRMPQESFEKLCTELISYIRRNKRFRDPISVEKQVAAALYYLADEGSM